MSEASLMETVEGDVDGGGSGGGKPPGRGHHEGFFRKLGRIGAEQALPLAVGAISFVIAVDAWLSSRPLEWEQQRALASVEIAAETVSTQEDENTAVTTVTVTNVGALTFAILDMHVRIELVGDLTADWARNSLVQSKGAALPIGLRPFQIRDSGDPGRGEFRFDGRARSWHVVDPGRSVDISFVQPTRGSGWMAISVNIFTQPMRMGDVADEITVDDVVGGELRPTLPEFGEGQVSDLPVFPYSSGHILIVSNRS